jgi:hypothetical protein
MIGFFRPNLEDCTKLVKSAAYASMLKHTKKKTKPVEYVKFEDAKEVIKIRKSRKEKNNTIAKRKRTNNRPFTYT